MPDEKTNYTVIIASYLEAEHVARIRQVDPRLKVVFEPELLATPKYPADHYGGAHAHPRTGCSLAGAVEPGGYSVRFRLFTSPGFAGTGPQTTLDPGQQCWHRAIHQTLSL